MNCFHYTITKVDLEQGVLVVEFGHDQGWAEIPLVKPFPTTKEEIDALVRPWVRPKGHICNIPLEDRRSEVGFLLDVVGKTFEGTEPDPAPVAVSESAPTPEPTNSIQGTGGYIV